MPTDRFKLDATWGTRPQDGALFMSGAPSINDVIKAWMTLDNKNLGEYVLSTDAPQVVAFGGVADANVVIITSDRQCQVQLTTSYGTLQSVPCENSLIIVSRTVPVTAIQVTRVPGTLTNVNTFVGEMA